ncbi:MAG: hypothetical protein O6761_08335 [Thaumarchaeota archaeon]|nr:hypothetical protein [Nitrososphaerota archaeon]
MKVKLLIVMVLGFGAVASYGFLEFNDVDLTLQSLGVTTSVELFAAGFNCACSDSNPPGSEGGFDIDNCNVTYTTPPNDGPDGMPGTADDFPGVAAPGSLGIVGNMLCLWESHEEDYGENLPNGDYEGCNSKSWLPDKKTVLTFGMMVPDKKADDIHWPAGFSPDHQFNDVFLTTSPSAYNDDDEEEEVFFIYFKGKKKFFKYFDNEKDFFKHIKDNKKFYKYFEDKVGDLVPADELQYKHEKEFFIYFKDKESFMNYFDDDKDFFKHIKNKKDFLKHFKDDKGYKDKSFTLEDALKGKGKSFYGHGASKKFVKEATVALLNAAHNEINYPYNVQEIMRMTQDAIVDKDYKEMEKEFKAYNKLGDSLMCP